jgi:large subunit ribosomal protein L21
MYAVIETGGKQYQVRENDVVFVEKLLDENGKEKTGEVVFDKVLVVSKEDGIKTGVPYLTGATVTSAILKTSRAKKITVFTYKPKKGVKRKIGHRQPYSQVKIEKITA